MSYLSVELAARKIFLEEIAVDDAILTHVLGRSMSERIQLSRRIVDRINCVFASQLFDGASS
jgi:hypothetical protein